MDPEGESSPLASDPSLETLLGYADSDQTTAEWWARFLSSVDLDFSSVAIPSLAQGKTWEDRLRIRDAAGNLLVFRMRFEPTVERSGLISVVGLLRDESRESAIEAELLEARGRLGLLDIEVPIAGWTTDDALRVQWSSGSALVALGHHENAFVGRTIYEMFDTQELALPVVSAHLRALAGETAGFEVSWSGVNWRAMVQPMRDELGRISGVMGEAINLESLLQVAQATDPSFSPGPPLNSGLDEVIEVGGCRIDPATFEVRVRDELVDLTVTEFKLILAFAALPGRTLSRQELAKTVWGYELVGEGASVTMAVKRLRAKIEEDPANPKIIETVRGRGYRMIAEAPPS